MIADKYYNLKVKGCIDETYAAFIVKLDECK